jgi:hypothetical protein
MPVRNRKNRRKPVAGLSEWESVFSSEFDFFGELRDAGVATDEYGRPDVEVAREAWQRLGDEFLLTFRDSFTPWAVAQFGEPR